MSKEELQLGLSTLAESIMSLTASHDTNVSIRGTNHREVAMIELKRAAAGLSRSIVSDNVSAQVDDVEGRARIAQSMNAIGTSDLEMIIAELDKIRDIIHDDQTS